MFVKLHGTRFNDFALNNLLDIYQQEKDWKKAIEIAEVAAPTWRSRKVAI